MRAVAAVRSRCGARRLPTCDRLGAGVRCYAAVAARRLGRVDQLPHLRQHIPIQSLSPHRVLTRSLSSSPRGAATAGTTLQQLEASLTSQLSSAALSAPSTLPIVRRLLDVYLAQHKHAEAEALLWRLCDEQTRGGTATATGEPRKDDDTLDAIRTMASIVSVKRATSSSHSASATTGVLHDLLDRYHTLTASSSSAVFDHPAHSSFVASLARQYIDEGDSQKAERVLRSALLFDEPVEGSSGGSGTAELGEGRRLRYATAYNFLGIAAYSPPVHVHSEACAHGHGHAHEDEQLKQYDWSTSEQRWQKALSYLDPFIAHLSSAHRPASQAAVFTPDSPSLHLLRTYAMTEDNRSQAQFTSGKEDEAVATLQRSINALAALLPPHHTELLRVRHQLIRLLLAANNVSQAQKECEPILSLDHRSLSLELTASLDDLADSLFRLKQYQTAARLFQQCIAVREAAAPVITAQRSDGSESEGGGEASGAVGDLVTASRYNDLAMCELKLNNHTAAEQHLRRAIAIKESVLGADHSDCAVSVHNLGAALMGLKRYDEAEAELQRARRLYDAKYAQQQASAGQERDREAVQGIVSTHLGQCYSLMERWADSVAEYRRAVSTKQRAMGDHPSVAMDMTQLGSVLLRAGQHAEAVEAFEAVLAMAERLYGTKQPTVAVGVALHWLSTAEARAGRPREAVNHARQAVLQGELLLASGAIQLSTLEVMKGNLTEQLRASDGTGGASGGASTATVEQAR